MRPFLFGIAALTAIASPTLAGPYAPKAGATGSTAIDKDSSSFVSWATGYQNYVVGTNVDAVWQTPNLALGKASDDAFDIVGLGNHGSIELTFDRAITNGNGFDFAVFENAITDNFLELAWVEVSSDGTNFYRFPNDSLTPSAVASFGTIDPTNIDGLAGKYRIGFGTPFDLEQLKDVQGLDVTNVTRVRIVDIVGDGTAFDTAYTGDPADVIYDPYPNTGSAGFDLDAIGVINQVPEPGAITVLVGGFFLAARRRRAASIH